MKNNFIKSALLAASVLFSFAAFSATNMLGTAGITDAALSTCPATAKAGTPQCASGWFNLNGAYSAAVHVTASAGTNTVLVLGRMCATCPSWTIQTFTNATSTQAPYVVVGPVGWVSLSATAVSSGTVKATVSSNSMQGVSQW